MRVLIIAMADSVHTARWIAQFAGSGWRIHLFPSRECDELHPLLQDVTVWQPFVGGRKSATGTVRRRGIPVFSRVLAREARRLLGRLFPGWRPLLARMIIRMVKPDILHTMETQSAGYTALEARSRFGKSFPVWIHSNWGIDLHFFARLEKHREKIRALLSHADIFVYEGKRDLRLATGLGFAGRAIQLPSVTAGYDLERCAALRERRPPSRRRIVLVKGYQNAVRRALVALRALERCADVLADYEILVYSASRDVAVKTELIAESAGLRIRTLPRLPHEEFLETTARARISLGINLSDGVPVSVLEAMMMGAFPIQSSTSCCEEWITSGQNGILVPPEDPEVIEAALRRALSDDALVDRAAALNYALAKERLDSSVVARKAVEVYQIARATGHPRPLPAPRPRAGGTPGSP